METRTASRYLVSPRRSRYRRQKAKVPKFLLIVLSNDFAEVILRRKIEKLAIFTMILFQNSPQRDVWCIKYLRIVGTVALYLVQRGQYPHKNGPHSHSRQPGPSLWIQTSQSRNIPLLPSLSDSQFSLVAPISPHRVPDTFQWCARSSSRSISLRGIVTRSTMV